MNERWTLLFALFFAEIGGALALLLAAPQRVRTAGFTAPVDVLLPHAGVMALVWALAAAVSWVLTPKLWRVRQERSNKLWLLVGVSAVWCVNDNLASLFLYLDPSLINGELHPNPSGDNLVLALLLRSAGGLICFWLAVLLHDKIAARHVPQMTPNPKFGKG